MRNLSMVSNNEVSPNTFDYDFSTLCADQVEKVKKRLTSVNKSFLKEYKLALNVINSAKANEARQPLLLELETLLHDQVSKSEIFYTETLNKIQRAILNAL